MKEYSEDNFIITPVPERSFTNEEEKRDYECAYIKATESFYFDDPIPIDKIEVSMRLHSEVKDNALSLHLFGTKGEHIVRNYNFSKKFDTAFYHYEPSTDGEHNSQSLVKSFGFSCSHDVMLISFISKEIEIASA
jgi:hypothetical protein